MLLRCERLRVRLIYGQIKIVYGIKSAFTKVSIGDSLVMNNESG